MSLSAADRARTEAILEVIARRRSIRRLFAVLPPDQQLDLIAVAKAWLR